MALPWVMLLMLGRLAATDGGEKLRCDIRGRSKNPDIWMVLSALSNGVVDEQDMDDYQELESESFSSDGVGASTREVDPSSRELGGYVGWLREARMAVDASGDRLDSH